MKLTIVFCAALAVALSASAASALPIGFMNDGGIGSRDTAIVQVKSMPSRAIYHHGSHHRRSQRGLSSNHRY